ncbi:MAG TPA: DNA sulfur modification protein DndE [Bacilli bacterium]|nr:DNA sulfur modification protein DndE [Bacilli bacterium]
MNFRLKTSKETEERLRQLSSSTSLTPNILARLAIALSLNVKETPQKVKDTGGAEYNRNTLTGKYDYVYKTLIAQHAGIEISDDEFFPGLFNEHLERGVRLLSVEYQYAGNYEKLITNLIEKC